MTVQNQTILVTGSSSGFGALTARALAEAGHNVFASMRDSTGRNAPQARALTEWASAAGHDLRALELDIQSEASIRDALKAVRTERESIDVLVHNAGHMVLGPSEAFTPEQLAEQYDINVLGAQRLNRAVLPEMRARRAGLLVWVGSSSTRGGTPPWLGPYFAAEAAMDALAVCYAGELSRWGVETSIIVPGAYMSGTNHFVHAGRPDNAATTEAYARGPYEDFETSITKGVSSLASDDEDEGDVAQAIVKVIDAPRGRRPFRVHINTAPDGTEIVNAVADRVRSDFLRRAGLEDILQIKTADQRETSS